MSLVTALLNPKLQYALLFETGLSGLNVFTALKRTYFYIVFVATAAGVVSCGGPKM